MKRASAWWAAVAGIVIGMAFGPMASADEEEPGELHRLEKAGSYSVSEGDVIEIAVVSNPFLGPNNPASNLKVEVRGDAVEKFGVVFVPPRPPLPGAPGHLRAYLAAENEGKAAVKVILINGKGKEGEPLEFEITVKDK